MVKTEQDVDKGYAWMVLAGTIVTFRTRRKMTETSLLSYRLVRTLPPCVDQSIFAVSSEQILKALVRLYAWYAPLMFPCNKVRFSRVEAN